ncbi:MULTISPECIES: ATP-binding protein [unclassified Ruegeria]|uniref:ATP-binding protein n=1 Tax=unclassified Ruegeria TaxID=2625375 RepID=UPI0014908B23|nr:ATP-binding protein [Ruegeria sp. HKCCD7559]NOD86141.1 ATP-binding protein [Ruegeria sp. HKCCD6119]
MEPIENKTCLELTFPATESEASEGIAKLSVGLAERGLPPHKAGDVKIALAEAINNVVEHAYNGIAAAKVQVTCRLDRDLLDILISDTGRPLPGYRLPDGTPAPMGTDLQDLPEGGFGWFLIHRLTSDIRYERRGGCNRLSLRFDFEPNG